MEADDGQAKNNFTNLAPRPWRSFKTEQAEVMVVQKRSRISLPARVSLEGGNTAKESNKAEEGERSKIPKEEEELNGSSAEGKAAKEDEADDAGVYRNLIKEQKNGLNPFDSDEEEEVIERKVGVRTSKKRKAPQPPVKVASSSSDSIQEDATKTLNSSEAGKVIIFPVKGSSNSKEEDGDTVENKEEIVEKTTTRKEGEITERGETVLHDGDTVCEEKKVELRTMKRVIDMTIRTSTIEDLDEEDILQELSDGEETKPPQNDPKTDDEIDHEKAKELVLNVETLEHNVDRKETEEETNRGEERDKVELLTSELQRAASGRISIRHGWSSFMRGIRPTRSLKRPSVKPLITLALLGFHLLVSSYMSLQHVCLLLLLLISSSCFLLKEV